MEKALTTLVLAALLWASPVVAGERQSLPSESESTQKHTIERPDLLHLSLEECMDIALKNNRRCTVSKLSVQIAEALHRQALSTYWPQMVLKSAFTQRDDHPLFIFPEETDLYTISTLVTQDVQAAVTVPEKRAKLMDRTHFTALLDVTSPLYTGGMRSAINRQAKAGLEAAKQEVRRTSLQASREILVVGASSLQSQEELLSLGLSLGLKDLVLEEADAIGAVGEVELGREDVSYEVDDHVRVVDFGHVAGDIEDLGWRTVGQPLFDIP